MAKSIFKPMEVVNLGSKMLIEVPGERREEEELEELPRGAEEYSGPTVDDLKKEADAFRQQWETERQAMVDAARAEAEKIVKDAEAAAFEEVKRKSNQAQKIKQEAEEAAKATVEQAQARVREIEAQMRDKIEAVEREAFKKGQGEGHEQGFAEGKAEVERLVDRLHTVIERAMDKRTEILDQTESQIVELVLLIARKVVKVISENQKNVVVSNIAQALRKLKTRSDVLIRVNLADLSLATEHVKDFVAMAENAKKITIVEDTAIDRGGCIIETDFGEIDARIASQLHELEEKILDIAPIKARGKVGGAGQA
jgi:flagellar assembly protein FliH